MKIVLVDWKEGRPVIQWAATLGLTLGLGLVMGTGSGGLYTLWTGAWNQQAALGGAGVGAGIVLVGLIAGMQRPKPDEG